MIVTKLKVTLAMILFAAVLVTGAGAWAMHDREAVATVVATKIASPVLKPEPDPAQENAPAPPEHVTRTIRGIVRDEQGRPVAKAWVGDRVSYASGSWDVVEPLDRIRGRKETTFRDEHGNDRATAVARLANTSSLRDEAGKWRALPIHPAKPISVTASNGQAHLITICVVHLEYQPSPEVKTALETCGKNVFEVQTARGRWEMHDLKWSGPADRTDPQGNFLVEFTILPEYGAEVVHFASPDFSRQAIFAVRYDDPDEVLTITLKPVRLVRARVIETPEDRPDQSLQWDVFTVDPKAGNLDDAPAIGGKGAVWLADSTEEPDLPGPPYADRRFDARLPAGHYKIRFNSDTVSAVTDLVVPAGDGPLDLPDIHLETLAWAKTLGKTAAEIDAVDLTGKPVKLADYRGKTVVLCFWSSKQEKDVAFPELPRLAQIRQRFKGQPLAILVVHDSSLSTVASLNTAIAPILGQFKGDPPVQFLLDRNLANPATRRYVAQWGEIRSGRTSDAYETAGSGATLVIDKSGTLVAVSDFEKIFSFGKDGQLVRDFGEEKRVHDDHYDDDFQSEFGLALLVRSLEEQFGLPRSPLPKPKLRPPTPEQLKGNVVDRDGKPIAGARIFDSFWNKPIKSGPTGEFVFSVEERRQTVIHVNVEASGFATRCFILRIQDEDRIEDSRDQANSVSVDPSGAARQPLKMSPGVAVTGRVLQNGRPVAGVLIGLKRIDPEGFFHPKALEASTDAQGYYRFPHSLPETEFWVYAKLGTLADGGAIIPQRVETTEEGSTTDLGEFHVEKGFTLAGRVVCSDGKPVPGGTSIDAECPNADGSLSVTLDKTGRFEFKGLPAGPVSVRTRPAGYFVSAKNRCHGPSGFDDLKGQLGHDIADLTILLEPGAEPKHDSDPDPALVADFNDAKAGPITGVPPRP